MYGFIDLILMIGCLYIAYSHQQINIILNFISIIVILFLSFFSLTDIQLLSFFVGIIYSGGLVISFMFVIMILDINIFNLANKLAFVNFILFFNQQVYNSFTFLLFSLTLIFLMTTRKVKQYQKDIIYELLFFTSIFNLCFIDLLLLQFIYLHWFSFLCISLNDYDMQVIAKIFYHHYNALLCLIAFYF